MRRFLPVGVIGLSLSFILYSCVDSRYAPTTPSPAADVTSNTVNWQCRNGTQSGSTSVGDWTFLPSEVPCPRVSSESNGAGAPVTGAPQNLRATVTGSTVRLDWGYPPGEFVNGFQLEAGSAPGLSNLAIIQLPSAPAFVVVTNVPDGVYYVRVRGTGGPLGPPSNEVQVRVSVTCGGQPGPPSGMTAQVLNNLVNLAWNSPGGPVTSYIIEAGSAPGLSNIVVFDTGNALTALSATAPNGVYYVRGRAKNPCGVGAASPDLVVAVGATPPPTPSSSSTTTSSLTSTPTTVTSTTSVPGGPISTTSTTTSSITTISSTSSSSTSSSSTSSSSTSTSSTTTSIPNYTVTFGDAFGYDSSNGCNVEQATGCVPHCRFEATVTPSMPGAQYTWTLGNVGPVSTGSSNIIDPDWRKGYCPLPASTITTATVFVTVTNSLGAKAVSTTKSYTIGTT